MNGVGTRGGGTTHVTCLALILGRATCTKHMYAPLGPLGLLGSTTSLPLPRPFFLPSLPAFLSSLAFLPGLVGVSAC